MSAQVDVDPDWFSFPTFLVDMGRCPEGMKLGRFDATHRYERENCCWVPVVVSEPERTAPAPAPAPVQVTPVVQQEGIGKAAVLQRRPSPKAGQGMSIEKAREIRRLKAEVGLTSRQIAHHVGVHRTTVDKCLRGESWKES